MDCEDIGFSFESPFLSSHGECRLLRFPSGCAVVLADQHAGDRRGRERRNGWLMNSEPLAKSRPTKGNGQRGPDNPQAPNTHTWALLRTARVCGADVSTALLPSSVSRSLS